MRHPELPDEGITQNLDNLSPLSFKDYGKLPQAAYSFALFLIDYQQIKHTLGEEERKLLSMGPPMLVTLWAYTKISGRNLATLSREDTLIPGVMLYRNVVYQDDNLDFLRQDDPDISAKSAFWNQKGIINPSDFRFTFRSLISRLQENESLIPDAKQYITKTIGEAYRSYVTAEDELVKMRGRSNADLDRIHDLRTNSYGAMARAITAIWNGNSFLDPNAGKIEETLIWFEMAVGIIDNELDRDEDRSNSMTPVLAADAYDEINGFPQGLTAEKLLCYYLKGMDHPEITSFLLTARYIYPKFEYLLKTAGKIIFRDSQKLVVQRDSDLKEAMLSGD